MTTTINAYSFDELDKEAQRQAVKDALQSHDPMIYNSTQEAVLEDAAQCGEVIGIHIAKEGRDPYKAFWDYGNVFYFDGWYEHAPGSIRAIRQHAPLDADLHAIADELWKVQRRHQFKLKCDINEDPARDTQYATAFECSHCHVFDDPMSHDWPHDVMFVMQEQAEAFSKWVLKNLHRELEYRQSDEFIIEHIKDNDYKFTHLGVMI